MPKRLTGFDLKIIGIIFMVIDHVNIYLGPELGLPLWVSFLGRFVAPLFVFLMVEGLHYTHDRKHYFSRMFLGGLLMTAINVTHNLLTRDTFTNEFTGKFDVFLLLQGQNIFLTLAFLMLLLWGIDTMRYGKRTRSQQLGLALGLLLLISLILFSEGGPYELVLALIFYFGRGHFKRIAIAITAFCVLLFAKTMMTYFVAVDAGNLYQLLTFSNEFMIITVLPFLYFYNGQRGGSGAKWQRNLFYYFYPLHLVVIYLLHDLVTGII